MADEKKTLGQILLEGSYVTKEEIEKAEQTAKDREMSLADYLIAEDILSKDILGQATAESLHLPYVDIGSHRPSKEQVLRIPEDVAMKYRVVLLKQSDTGVVIATDNPNYAESLGDLRKVFPAHKVTFEYAISDGIDAVLTFYRKTLNTRFSKIIEGQKHVAPEILEEIFEDALTYNASDIHFEPQGEQIIVRFRIDGVLQKAGDIPSIYYENILNRVKVQSQLRIDEHYRPQDGSLRYEAKDVAVDMRTSIVPTVLGEKIVLRVLAAYVQGLTLSSLGLSSHDQQLLQEMSEKPFGMLLVTGPTGSGKTTTLYALLKLLNKPDVNVTTIEDPVEYKTRGVNQIQVNAQTDLTFAKGLRSIVRQDPDIILVGEIRDNETAEIAVNAALTGHLLLSTFHANDAATAVPRLLEMNIEPFLLSSTLQVVLAQRLVRKICEYCRYSNEVDTKSLVGKQKDAVRFLEHGTITLYQGKGCEACGYSGYKGRTAIFEMIVITTEIQNLILARASSQQLWDAARTAGARSMFEDGIDKVMLGVTSLEELVRVIEPPKGNAKHVQSK